MIHFKEDPLLNTKKKNIYQCFVKEKDLRDKNFTLRTPTIRIKSELVTKVIENRFGNLDKGLLFLIRSLEKYASITFKSIPKAKYRYKQLLLNNRANIVFLRVMSLELGKDERERMLIFRRMTTYAGAVRIENIKIRTEKPSERIVYLAGVIAGDGHLDKRETEIVIADGHPRDEMLNYSERFLMHVAELFQDEFNVSCTTKREKSYWRLSFSSKWLCRYFNYYFNIPFGPKCHKVRVPTSLSPSYEKFFWRGIMDTDGFVRESVKQIGLKTVSYPLMKKFKVFCNKNKIKASLKREGNGWRCTILTRSMLQYAQVVGFMHPRKQKILGHHLMKGPKYKVLKKVGKRIPNEWIPYMKHLRPYKKSVYIKLDEDNKKKRKQDIVILMQEIERALGHKIIEVTRARHNNHHYICSRSLSKLLQENVVYGPAWKALNKKTIEKLKKRWSL